VGRYTFDIPALAPGAYIQDIRQSGRSIYDSGLSVGGGPAEVEFVINTKGATVNGTVLNAAQRPFASAQVALVPHESRRQNPALYKTAISDAAGNFTISGVAPGEYKLFAWEYVPATAWMNPDFLSRHEARGQSITLASGSPVEAHVILIPLEISWR
jgi:hypothetical protein